MASITLGAKARNYDLNVSDIDLDSLMQTDYDIKIGFASNGDTKLTLEYGNDSVILEGDFNLSALSGNFSNAIDEITKITVVDNGKVSYSISNVSIDSDDISSVTAFADFLFSASYKMSGNGTNNTLAGADRNDKISGLAGADKLFGLDGNDKLYGGAGNDVLNGGDFNDVLVGGAGRDRLVGGKHNDVLTGGSDSDVFIFGKKFGTDTITDFDATGKDHDVIDLSGFSGVDSFKDLDISRHKGDVTIEFAGHNEITLEDVNLKHLDKHDFDF